MTRPSDFAERAAAIVADGLPCQIACRSDGGFTRLDLIPLPGWTHLADDATVAEHLAMGSHYHISLSTWPSDEGAWCRICERWDGIVTTIRINRITSNGGAELAWTGLGSDPDLWTLYMEGSYKYKWHDNQYGLHISM